MRPMLCIVTMTLKVVIQYAKPMLCIVTQKDPQSSYQGATARNQCYVS